MTKAVAGAAVSATIALIVLVTLVAGWEFFPRGTASAVSGTVDFVGIDMEIGATPANTATSLGSIETCNTTTALAANGSNTLELDVVVDAIDPADPAGGFQFGLVYDPAVVKVTAVDEAMLLASGGGFTDVGPTDAVPDTDGTFVSTVADFGSNHETGEGVLSRIELTGVGNGVSDLTLVSLKVTRKSDAANLVTAGTTVGTAKVAVGTGLCSEAAPTPTPTPPPVTTLTVEKVVVNDDGRTGVVGDFTIRLDGTAVTSGEVKDVFVGAHEVNEDFASGYTTTIGGDCDAEGTVTVLQGQSLTCTVTNDDLPLDAPKLTVKKVVTNDDGGTAQASDFTLRVDGQQVFNGITVEIAAGEHTISEDPNTSYTATIGGDCDASGKVTLAAGEDRTCTITNNDVAGAGAVAKVSLSPATTAAASGSNVAITCTVADSAEQGVAGQDVTFSIVSRPSGSDASVSPTTASSDANGKATATLKVGKVTGDVVVKCSAGGESGQTTVKSVAELPTTGFGGTGDNGGVSWIVIIAGLGAGLSLALAAAGIAYRKRARTRAPYRMQ